jgi:hypothetical protein
MREFLTQSPLHLIFAGLALLSALFSSTLTVQAGLRALRRPGGRHGGPEFLWTLVPALALLLVTFLCATVPPSGRASEGGRPGTARLP